MVYPKKIIIWLLFLLIFLLISCSTTLVKENQAERSQKLQAQVEKYWQAKKSQDLVTMLSLTLNPESSQKQQIPAGLNASGSLVITKYEILELKLSENLQEAEVDVKYYFLMPPISGQMDAVSVQHWKYEEKDKNWYLKPEKYNFNVSGSYATPVP